MKVSEDGSINSAWILDFFWKRKLLIIGGGLFSAIVVFITTLFVTPKYESTAIVYAAGVNSSQMQMSQGNTLLLLQLLESNNIIDKMIEEFDLASHYGIDTSQKNWQRQVGSVLKSNTSFERTIYKSVKIKVRDSDPDFAAHLANGLVDVVNKLNDEISREHKSKVLEKLEKNFENKLLEVDSLAKVLSEYKNLQVENVTENLNALLIEKNSNITKLRNQIKKIRQDAGSHSVSQQLDEIQKSYLATKGNYLYESGKLKVFTQKLNENDSIRIKSEAKLAGLELKMKLLEEKLENLNFSNDKYLQLINDLALQISLRDQLIIRIENIRNTYEPGVVSIEMQKKDALYQAELDNLKELKVNLDKAREAYNAYEPATYEVSKAVPVYTPVYPRKVLFALIAFLLTATLVFGILLLMQRK
jgi:capsular polysaccharide biosynthesis protein